MNTPVNIRQGGFTMIEVLIVLAISGLLLLITLFGQGPIRTQSEFRDGAESFRAQLETIKDEVSTTVSRTDEGCLGFGAGRRADCVKFGKLVNFNNNSSGFTTREIVGDGPGSADPSPNVPVTDPVFFGNTAQKELDWQIEFRNQIEPNQIVFARHSGTGALLTYVLDPTDNPVNENTYTINNPGEPYRLRLEGPSCDTAEIIFNEPVNTVRLEFGGRECL
jgi:prepilin-type N-terminal cleavage/methylation domain-containing protein